MNKILKNKMIIIPSILIAVAFVITYLYRSSYALPLENDVEVEEYSELTYYLNISYDGKDQYGVESSDTATSKVVGDTIYIKDKIPDGLLFLGFVTTEDGSIGAVKRSDNTYCPGKVIDDNFDGPVDDGVWDSNHIEFNYHGLHYNENTRTVSFNVKNLQAGCVLTVGIKTMTQDVDDHNTSVVETRRDFYNFFVVQEKDYIVNSNTVHAFIGDEEEPLHDVDYEYTGDVPEAAPAAPLKSRYAKSAKVGVAPSVDVPGYEFSGWETDDVSVNDESFVMPDRDVTLRGSFEEVPKYQVVYQIEGDKPSNYVVPTTKEYPKDEVVNVDSLAVGANINGYRFLGWTSSDVTITEDNNFVMPEKNVTIVGRFEEIKYKVTYAFYNTVTPPNADSLLPEVKYYKPGVRVTHPTMQEVTGYRFLGWYKEDNFIMPEEDVTVYGEWMVQNGTYEPTISKEIVDKKESYNVGDVVEYKITVTNPEDFEIRDIVVREENAKAKFVAGTGYELQTEHLAKITKLSSKESIALKATFTIGEDDYDKVNNKVTIVGARASDNYIIVDKEISDSEEFNIKTRVIIHHYIEGTDTKVHEDQVIELPFASVYSTNPLNTDELDEDYRNKYHVNDDDVTGAFGIISKNLVEVTYYYTINKYNINVKVVGGVGTITGKEEVVHGENSKETIVITPSEGYEIAKVIVDGNEITISNNLGMTLDKFENVLNDHLVEVEFRELKAETPITGIKVSYTLVVVLILCQAFVAFVIYRKSLKR